MADSVRADAVKPEKVEWLWRERIPRGMMSIIGGRPDEGKGLACAAIAADVSRMKVRDWLTGQIRPANVLYSAAEDSYSLMTVPRLIAAGANMKHVRLYRFAVPRMMEELRAQILKHKIDLLVIDPLAAHLSSGVSRQSDNIRTVTGPITELIEQTGTAVLVVEHVLKRVSPNSHPLAAIGGSGSGIVAASRMCFLFGTSDKDPDRRMMCPVKHNITVDDIPAFAFEIDAKELGDIGEVPFLVFAEESDYSAARLLDSGRVAGKRGRPSDKKAAAAEWLTNYLYAAGKPVKSTDVFEDGKQYGFTTKTLRRAAVDIEVVKNPPGGGPKVTWVLSDELRALLDGAPVPPPKKADKPATKSRVEKPKDADQPAVDDSEVLSDEDIRKLLGGNDE